MNILMHIPSDEFAELVSQHLVDMATTDGGEDPDAYDEASVLIGKTIRGIIEDWITPGSVPLDELMDDECPIVRFVAKVTKLLQSRFKDMSLIEIIPGTTSKSIFVVFQSKEFKI